MLQILEQIEPYVYEWTSKHRGSISAEHGLGLMKANKIYYSKSPGTVSFPPLNAKRYHKFLFAVFFSGSSWLLHEECLKGESVWTGTNNGFHQKVT